MISTSSYYVQTLLLPVHYSFLPWLRLHPDTPSLVLGPLKLAKKYQADALRDRIIAHAYKDCPITLEDWDEVAYSSPANGSDISDETSQPCLYPSDYSTKDFLPDPISFMALARECDLPAIFSTLLYSLCRDSATRNEKLSRMTKADLETLFLGKERMIHYISEQGAVTLEIDWWVQPWGFDSDVAECIDRGCRLPIFKTWSTLLQAVMCDGDPLATFREAALTYRKDEPDDNDSVGIRDELCFWCKARLANKLDDLRQDLFGQLPSFFPLQEINPQATQD